MNKKIIYSFIIIIVFLILGFINYDNKKDYSEYQEKKFDLLYCSYEDLVSVPGIGPSKANDIINYRTLNSFKNIEDLKNISGIGEKTYEKISVYFYLSQNTYINISDTLNINSCSEKDLISLPGIGKKTAEKIISYRKIKKIENYDEFKIFGLSEKEIQSLKGLIEF
ncbi:MAG TPA: helix-hairpin-helix domain-containing protein [Tepiditoga sp.]|nr:helix-hairpin-helix domain-containing protein [Tepiditoga sp.]